MRHARGGIRRRPQSVVLTWRLRATPPRLRDHGGWAAAVRAHVTDLEAKLDEKT